MTLAMLSDLVLSYIIVALNLYNTGEFVGLRLSVLLAWYYSKKNLTFSNDFTLFMTLRDAQGETSSMLL